MTSDSMEPLRGFANYGARELARLTQAAERSARRWIKDGLAPRPVVRLLEIIVDGTLGAISPQWNGWTIRRDGRLHSPDGPAYTPDEIRAVPLLHQQVNTLRFELERRQAPQISERQRLAIAQALRQALAVLESPQHPPGERRHDNGEHQRNGDRRGAFLSPARDGDHQEVPRLHMNE